MQVYTILSWDSNDNINHLSFSCMACDVSRTPQQNSSLIIQNCPLYKMCLDRRIRKQDDISFCYLSQEYEIHYSRTASLFFQYVIFRTRKTYGFFFTQLQTEFVLKMQSYMKDIHRFLKQQNKSGIDVFKKYTEQRRPNTQQNMMT